MLDQSPHWGLRTAFPSILRPLLIRAKLGQVGLRGVGGKDPPKCAKDSPVLGQGR